MKNPSYDCVLKVIRTIISCKNQAQLQVASRMVDNFIMLFGESKITQHVKYILNKHIKNAKD